MNAAAIAAFAEQQAALLLQVMSQLQGCRSRVSAIIIPLLLLVPFLRACNEAVQPKCPQQQCSCFQVQQEDPSGWTAIPVTQQQLHDKDLVILFIHQVLARRMS